MRDEADYDLLLFAKLTPLKAAIPIPPSEAQAFTRLLIARIKHHLAGVKRLPCPSPEDLRTRISRLAEGYDFERSCNGAERVDLVNSPKTGDQLAS